MRKYGTDISRLLAVMEDVFIDIISRLEELEEKVKELEEGRNVKD